MDIDFMEMMQRANLQTVSSFIMVGDEYEISQQKSFQERLKLTKAEVEKTLHRLVNSETEEEILVAYHTYECTLISVFFAAGIKVGARLQAQLMGDA